MSQATTRGPRKSLDHITGRYDRVARVYSALELLFLITPRARRKAVQALKLSPGATVLEVGAGTGRNLPYLIEAVGPAGKVIAVDASPGMLAEAKRLVDSHGWKNVQLIEQDAQTLEIEGPVDGVLFALSYSVIPDPAPALERAWAALRGGGRVVIMDAGLTHSPLRRLLVPVAKVLTQLGPGDPYARPWEDFGPYGAVQIERFMLGIYYVLWVTKD